MISRFVPIAVTASLVVAALAMPAHAHDDHAMTGSDPHRHGGTAHGATGTDGAPGNPFDAKRTVRIAVGHDSFSTKVIQVRAGETVRFVVTNDDYESHEFGIATPREHDEHRAMMKQMPNMRHEDPNVVTIDPGQTKELIWRFGQDTNVEFACDIPGHAEHGMAGKFRVMQ